MALKTGSNFSKATAATLILFSLLFDALAQDTVLNNSLRGKLDSIESNILQQKRYIQVFLPRGHKQDSTQKFDVLYVLDGGNWNTGLVTQVESFLEGQGNIPPTIIVSVMGINRNVELTPTPLSNWKGSGGAEKFLSFIKNELIPHVNKNYPSDGDNTLWGHSLSGMFAIYAMVTEPACFKSYIAADPSIWWDSCLIARIAREKLPGIKENISLFISGREGFNYGDMRIDSIEHVLKDVAPKNVSWKIIPYSDETHSSIRLKTTYDGLRFSYNGLAGYIDFHPRNGEVRKGEPYSVLYVEDTAGVHYTTDGTVPTRASAIARRDIQLSGPAKITFKKFTSRPKYDKELSGQFVEAEIWKPSAKTKSLKPGGLNYRYYEGPWLSLPDFKSEKPAKIGVAGKNFSLDSLPLKTNYALLLDGMIEIKEDGYHVFLLNGDKDSKFYLNNKLIIAWDGDQQRRTDSYMLWLKKGFYPMRIEYINKNAEFKLEIGYVTPSNFASKEATLIPFEVQYHN